MVIYTDILSSINGKASGFGFDLEHAMILTLSRMKPAFNTITVGVAVWQ